MEIWFKQLCESRHRLESLLKVSFGQVRLVPSVWYASISVFLLLLFAEIYDGVYDGPILGQGVAGTVRKVRHKTTGIECASKELDISSVDTEAELRQLRNEISIMCQLDHPNIVRIE